ncbi:asparagine synthase (glutamine-hydrolyzing) [Mangrovimonas spongiae]|uniref:asparagine synthase (glutamine-hydrolyzing) n=1 Tax=Mangrovimonas spongiae TaxID=2494697 RepID=A0A3R9MV60_9FLAO|nr:asparagine synthase (glutamine-hydrolyzing) [Mangrovimonas spongiae]RSK41507.1 asparagine synthase (glutamine-hydrolyzing) [Mangrovimonas spongiae]
MCGIIGTLNREVNKEVLNAIHHRGPDYQSSYHWHNVSLGHTRLSIVDLSSAGNQPMQTDCGNYTIVFNGEVYNHQELRKELSGIQFKGHSDTETILYYLREKGIEAVKKFNGIFAFAFLDKLQNKLFIARDPFGVKPVYYHSLEGKLLAFCSEIKGLFALGASKELDCSLLTSFLKLKYSPSPYTLYKNIKKVKPGSVIEVNVSDKKITSYSYFGRVPEINNNISVKEALEQYDLLLRKAVKRQLMSDVPISLLLSGGVDSALLALLAKEESNSEIQTYTAGYVNANNDVNELEDAEFSAKHIGVKNTKVILDEKVFLKELPKLIDFVEEPLGTQSIFPIHFLSKQINEDGYKVTLTGQGVDEPWGGYNRYNPQELIESFREAPQIFKGALKSIKKDNVRRAIKAINANDTISGFTESYSLFDETMLKKLLNYDMFEFKDKTFTDQLIKNNYDLYNLESRSATSAMMALDARMNLADDLLIYTDKISMRHSIETRVPFLDIELMEFAESLPNSMKVTLFKNKILHKKLAERYLPKEIIYRKKRGFKTPRKQWFKGDVGEMLEASILHSKGTFGEVFNKEQISNYFALHRGGKVNYEKQLFSLIVMFYWMENNFK